MAHFWNRLWFFVKAYCIGGCPCETYDCEDFTTPADEISTTTAGTTITATISTTVEPVVTTSKSSSQYAVLMLFSAHDEHISTLIGLNGKIWTHLE